MIFSSFNHSFYKYSIKTYSLPVTVLGASESNEQLLPGRRKGNKKQYE
jgi:hypothetical protein